MLQSFGSCVMLDSLCDQDTFLVVLFVLIQYLEGHGDLVNGLIMGVIEVVIWLILVINLVTKSPGLSKYGKEAKKANCGARPATSKKMF